MNQNFGGGDVHSSNYQNLAFIQYGVQQIFSNYKVVLETS